VTLTIAVQYLISGILTGSVYGVVGVAIVIIYKATKVFNFAVGTLLTIGGLFFVSMITWFGLPFWAALLCVLLISGLVGYASEKIVLSRLLGQPLITMIMATLALDSILYGLILMGWTGYTVTVPQGSIPEITLALGPLFFSPELVVGFIASLLCIIVVGFLFQKTQLGLRMRSTAESHQVSLALGINIRNVFSLSWIIAAMVGTVAGIVMGNRVGLQAAITSGVVLKALPAVIFGGLDSVLGAFIGGIAVGVVEKMAGGFIGPTVADVTPYIIMLLSLLILPEGLFGEKRIERI